MFDFTQEYSTEILIRSSMSVLSANTLFHFTSKDALLGILKTGFRPAYSDEFGHDVIGRSLSTITIPMVCFCDLPLSRLDNHIKGFDWEHNGEKQFSKKYGNFGLGMSKEWGITKRLNPVLYATQESAVMEFIGTSYNTLLKLYKTYGNKWEKEENPFKGYFDNPLTQAMSIGSPPTPETYSTFRALRTALSNVASTFSQIKPYRNLSTGQIYYNEREWRYVVPYTTNYRGNAPLFWKTPNGQLFPLVNPKHSNYEYNIEEIKPILAQDYMLNFQSDDIKYIIVESKSDISDIINLLRSLPEKYSNESINELTTKILTCEQIHNDF